MLAQRYPQEILAFAFENDTGTGTLQALDPQMAWVMQSMELEN